MTDKGILTGPKQLEMFFHVTTSISNTDIERENIKAEALEKRVFDFFKLNPNKPMIWSDVAIGMGVLPSQYGSVKRCISHLVRDLKVIKLDEMELSIFGGKSHKHVYIL